MCNPVSEGNEAAVCQAVMEGAKEALGGYCSSIDEDLALLRDGQLSAGSRAEMAVRVSRLALQSALMCSSMCSGTVEQQTPIKLACGRR